MDELMFIGTSMLVCGVIGAVIGAGCVALLLLFKSSRPPKGGSDGV